MSDFMDVFNDLMGTAPSTPKPPKEGGSVEELLESMKHNAKLIKRENKEEK